MTEEICASHSILLTCPHVLSKLHLRSERYRRQRASHGTVVVPWKDVEYFWKGSFCSHWRLIKARTHKKHTKNAKGKNCPKQLCFFPVCCVTYTANVSLTVWQTCLALVCDLFTAVKPFLNISSQVFSFPTWCRVSGRSPSWTSNHFLITQFLRRNYNDVGAFSKQRLWATCKQAKYVIIYFGPIGTLVWQMAFKAASVHIRLSLL